MNPSEDKTDFEKSTISIGLRKMKANGMQVKAMNTKTGTIRLILLS